MNIDKKKLGKRIKDIRLKYGDTLEDFGKLRKTSEGEILNANRSLVSAWENGRYIPSPERIRVIATLGGVSINELLYGPVKEYYENILLNAPDILDYSSDTMISMYNFWINEYGGNTDNMYWDPEEVKNRYRQHAEFIKQEHRSELSASINEISEQIKQIIKIYPKSYNHFSKAKHTEISDKLTALQLTIEEITSEL